MRFLILCAACLFSVIISAQTSRSYYVAAKTGLSMREKPEVGAKVVDKIPYGTKVFIIENGEERKQINTEGMNGMWQPVKYNNKTGYIIDSYLFPWAPPKLATVKEMKNYLAQVSVPFAPKLMVRSGNMNNIEEAGWELTKQLYKNGAEWHQMQGYEYGGDTYFLPGFSLQQGFLLMRLIPEFKEVFGEKDEFPVETKTYTKGEIEYKVTVDKESYDLFNFFKRVTVEYSDGASYFLEMYMLDNQLIISFSSGV